MLVTDKLMFLHLHKSGGTFVNALLMHCVPSARQIGYHLPYREAPPSCRQLPVVGTVRSPWAYYVSWYHFQRSQAQPNILFQLCSDNGNLDFKESVENLVNLSSDDARLTMLEKAVPETYANYGLNLTKKCVRELRERQLGFYSFLYERLYAGAREPKILRIEQLRQQLRATLSSLGHLPNNCIERFLNEAPPMNISQHQAPAQHFDERLAGIVAQRDRTVIDRFGFVL